MIVDFDVMSKFCLACSISANELGEDSPEFYIWQQGHANDCQSNHSGSSASMEVKIAEEIWNRTKSYGFRFTDMLSDGDAKTYNHLQSLNVYGAEVEIVKEECVNHVGKR